jgi:hypothetical protein
MAAMKHLLSAPFLKITLASTLAFPLAAMSGCGSGTATTHTPTPIVDQPVAVMAGTVPLIGASVQLYAAGTTGNGSAGTLVVSQPLTSSTNGTFILPTFTCPSSTSVLYVIATGGATGTATGASNPEAVLGAVLGNCSAVSATASFTIDEATTVALAYAMSPFLTLGGKIGSSSTNTSGIALAAATAANLVNIGTGAAPGADFPSTGTAPTAKLNALANALNACITGGAASTACMQLFAATSQGGTAPTNTLDAMINLAKQPGTNASTLYTLSGGSKAYTPALSSAPADWMLYATYAGGGMNDPSALSIDSKGNVWVSSYFNVASAFSNTGEPISATGYTDPDLSACYGGAVNASDNFWETSEGGAVTPFSTSGSLGSFGGGGLNFPLAVAFSSGGVGWVVDYGDSSVSIFSATTMLSLAGSSGYQSSSLVFPVAVAMDASGNGWIANQSSNTVTRISANGSSFTSFVVGSSATKLVKLEPRASPSTRPAMSGRPITTATAWA